MKHVYRRFFSPAVAAFLIPLFCSISIHAESLVLKSESALWLIGDSTLHSYKSTASKIDAAIELEPGAGGILQRINAGKMKKLDVSIPVKAMKSGEKKLDANMQKALKEEQNPNILFHMTRYQTVPSTSNAQGFTINAAGTLNVAGVEKPVELVGNVMTVDNGVRIQGSKDVLMTDHGVKPPVILILKTRDKVVVHFDLTLGL